MEKDEHSPSIAQSEADVFGQAAQGSVISGQSRSINNILYFPVRLLLGVSSKRFDLFKYISFFKLSFIVWVVIPSLIVSLYFAFLASDQFSVEMRFAVRMAQFDFGRDGNNQIKSNTSLLGSSSGSSVGAPTLAGQEAYIVATYIRSASILDDFPMDLDLKTIFRQSDIDWWARLKGDSTREELAQYWRSMVDANVNNMSGVVTVTVRAFSPEDAYKIALAVIRASENLVNRLSERARNDAMDRAEQEVRRNEQLVRATLEDMRSYRDKEQLISPGTEASSASTLLLQTMSERIKLQNDYFVATRSMSPDAPSVIVLKSRLEAIDQQIDELKNRMTGHSEKRSISATIGKFEELELKRQFAERLYTMSQDALERARQKAEWQNIYLSVFVPPAIPGMALLPERLNMTLLISAVLLVTWGIIMLLIATIKDHMV